MIDTYPNPWDFSNVDKRLISPDNFHKVVYGDLNEIAMGAPIGGQCFLQTIDNKKLKIHDWCAGPPAWETDGYLLVIPIWTRRFFQGTVQQIGILDTVTKELKIFSKIFSVLDIRSFDKNLIYGYDSPIYKPKTLTFNIDIERIEKIIKLKE